MAKRKKGVNPIEGNLYSKVLMERNRGVDFVDRAFALGENPGTPLFNVPDDEQFGSNMSHKMAYGTDDYGQTWMYPTIFNDDDEAIKVPNQYADYISSEGYKKATGMVRKHGGPHDPPEKSKSLDEVTVTGSRKDPYEFGLDVNEKLGKAFDIMNQNPDAIESGSPHKYTDWYLDNYKAQDSKYTLQGEERADDPYGGLMSDLMDYDEENFKAYIDLYKDFIKGYQRDIDTGKEGKYTRQNLEGYTQIVSVLEDVLKNPIKPKSVVLGAELAPIIVYDKPTYKQAYKNVDKDKYPTYEDFEFAADYYNETGTNPDFQDLPSNRLAPPPEPEYEVNDIEPEIEIDRLPIVKSKLNLDAFLPEELEGVDYVLDKKGNISGFIKADPGKTGNRKRNYRKLKRGKKERALDDLNEGLQYKHGGPHDPPSYEDAMQAYEDSIAARAAYEDQYKLDLAQYEKDSADFKRRNAAYNKKLNAYNKAQDRYQRNQEYLNWLKAKYPAFPTYNEVYDSSDPNKGVYYYEHMTDAGEAQRPEFARGSLDKESGDRELHLSPWYTDAISIHPGSYSEDEINRLNLDMNNMGEFTDKYLSRLSGPEMELNAYNEFIDWGLGESSGDLPVITMLAPPNVKKPKPLEEQILKAVEYNPPEELERPTFSDYVDPLPVIEPEMIQDTSLPEELQEAEEVEGVDYKIKRGPYIQPGLGGNPFGRFGKKYYRGPRLKFGERRVPIKKEQVYEEDSMPLPVFFKDGGSMDLELSPEEVSMYVKGGYVVEELPSYEPGGANDSDNPLTQWADQQQSLWEGLYEYNPKGRDLATGYFQNIGDDYNLNLIKKGKMPHWSAATVSNAVMANIGASDKQTAQQLGFNPTASHSGYVRDAFKAAVDPEYKYNRYVAEKPDGNYGIGDILVKGRRDGKNVGTSKWSYKNFAKTDNPYVSHGDIIVDKGEDDKGEYVVLAGGNLGDTYKNKKVYTKDLANKYKVKLKDNKKGFTMGAAPGSANKVTAAPEKFNNVGEDVTVNTKKRSLFKNNFDSDTENDQSYNQEFDSTPSMSIPSASNFSGSLVPNQQAALFGDDTLGIGYVPYQYQFPEYLGRPQEEEMLDESYMTPYENILDDNDSDVVDPDPADEDDNIENNVKEDLSDITEEELEQLNDEDLEKHSYNKLTFKPKSVKFDKFEKKTLSKEAKTEIQRLEDEINNLKRSPIERANEISKQIKSLEEFGDETLNERKALAKERVRLLLAIQEGAVTKGTEIDDQIKELRGQIESIKLGESAYAVESGKVTEKDYYNKHHPGFIKATETINKKMEDGYVWVSWNRNISGDELYKRGYPEVILESLDKYQTNDWRPNVRARSNQKSNVYNSSLTGDEDIKFIEDYYGDGSNKYGQWVKSEDVSQVGGFSNRTLYPEQYNEDGSPKQGYKNQNYNPTMQNSGRAAGFSPEFNFLFGPLWGTIGLGDDLVSDERTVPYQEGPPDFIDQVGSDIGDALWSLKPYYFMDDLEKSRYRNMKNKRSGASYKNTFERTGEAIEDGAEWVGEQASDFWNWATDWQDGGSIPKIDEGYVINLDKEEALAYARKGYIVEEIK